MTNKYNLDECAYPEIKLMSDGDYYGQTTFYTIDAEEYNNLLKSSLMLQALMNTYVEDWCGFDSAVEEYNRLEKEME